MRDLEFLASGMYTNNMYIFLVLGQRLGFKESLYQIFPIRNAGCNVVVLGVTKYNRMEYIIRIKPICCHTRFVALVRPTRLVGHSCPTRLVGHSCPTRLVGHSCPTRLGGRVYFD